MYFTITNKKEDYVESKYIDNSNNGYRSGIWFTNVDNIFKFISNGIYLIQVSLPKDNPKFKMIRDESGDKWRANMIILGKQHDLFDLETFEYLIKRGANIHSENENALCVSAQFGYLNIVKFLIDIHADIHIYDDFPLRMSAQNGHLSAMLVTKNLIVPWYY